MLYCEIRDEFGDVESAAFCETAQECYHWFKDHGVNFSKVKLTNNTYKFQK